MKLRPRNTCQSREKHQGHGTCAGGDKREGKRTKKNRQLLPGKRGERELRELLVKGHDTGRHGQHLTWKGGEMTPLLSVGQVSKASQAFRRNHSPGGTTLGGKVIGKTSGKSERRPRSTPGIATGRGNMKLHSLGAKNGGEDKTKYGGFA